jgi:hypothetical protein
MAEGRAFTIDVHNVGDYFMKYLQTHKRVCGPHQNICGLSYQGSKRAAGMSWQHCPIDCRTVVDVSTAHPRPSDRAVITSTALEQAQWNCRLTCIHSALRAGLLAALAADAPLVHYFRLN